MFLTPLVFQIHPPSNSLRQRKGALACFQRAARGKRAGDFGPAWSEPHLAVLGSKVLLTATKKRENREKRDEWRRRGASCQDLRSQSLGLCVYSDYTCWRNLNSRRMIWVSESLRLQSDFSNSHFSRTNAFTCTAVVRSQSDSGIHLVSSKVVTAISAGGG